VAHLARELCYKPEGRRFEGVTGIFHRHNPFGRTVTQGLTQPLKEMSTGIFSGGKGGRCVGLTTLPPSCFDVHKSGSFNLLEPSGPVKVCNGIALP
jgi:hypothetical protein